LAVALVLYRLCKGAPSAFYAKDGLVCVGVSWIVLSLLGCLPFYLSREIPKYVDAFFEIVSGFTTTGASIVPAVEDLSHGILYWRSFSHWVGGMGVLVLMMAILPGSGGRAMHIMRAEVPGPTVGKLVPRLRDTAKILYIIYLGLTVIEVLFLLCGGMPLFDSLLHAFGTAGTGGFGIKADGLASYSPYLQWVITVFMLLFGVNFNLYYLILIRHFKTAFTNRELWVYGGVVLASITAIVCNTVSLYDRFGDAVRHASFQVAAIVTTTGFATTDFNLWPGFSKAILFLLMFMGGCAGSTAGGLKVSRIMLFFKTIARDLRRMLHPRSMGAVTMEGKRVDDAVVQGVSSYFVLFFVLFAACFLIVSVEPFSFETNLTAVASCLNNIGPGLGEVGPMGSFAGYSALSKVTLSLAMLFGRLEIYPLLLTLIPSTWTKE
ncbi:MAG: TrkH family potassium uptake protein, partial [Clostridia bacterium]|nr:TrkH family potassium uptake protein [Clostridia bacterium]